MDNILTLAKTKNWDIIKQKIEENPDTIDLNVKDDNNNYPLTYAIINSELDMIELMIKSGSKIDIVDTEGRSIIFLIIKFDIPDVLDIILKYNVLNVGIPVVDIVDKNKNIPLHYAIINKNKNAVKL